MNQDQEQNIRIKKIIKIFSILSYIFAIAAFILPVILINDNEYICFGIDLVKLTPILLWLVTIILILTRLYLSRKYSIKNNALACLIIVIIVIFFGIIIITSGSVRGRSRDATRKSDLKQIHTAQVLYFDGYEKYAEKISDLVPLFISKVPTDPETNLPYTDFDGVDIDGSDDNPKTWSVKTQLKTYRHELCSSRKINYYYECNQDGCRELEK